jgi:hypothetical protein
MVIQGCDLATPDDINDPKLEFELNLVPLDNEIE